MQAYSLVQLFDLLGRTKSFERHHGMSQCGKQENHRMVYRIFDEEALVLVLTSYGHDNDK